ncbi:hypothetical protein F511_11016 [Dorcoceras hygrometricum]|uniref:RWD domain-containing protein n=1 Tax=Dorcoceras hygrometricum TaxID=472368 RepID=A0A2Z7CRS0_9LAMI|nr:hypothetical protein F511_11016 [Dorcoceras hygrometricum]
MAEEEVLAEVEAVQAVYGDDCRIIKSYPPHLHVQLKPRTAGVSSVQFVEAIIGIQASPQYPEEAPDISVVYSKGLDEQRQEQLISSLRDKALELVSCLMLVTLCEEAAEVLSSMNHPDGCCPLCLYPIADENVGNNSRPFMKLMSCFHCFHCDCFVRWWNWILMQSETGSSNSSRASKSSGSMQDQLGTHGMMEESMRKCPVCREVFLFKDIEHMLDVIGTATHMDSDETDIDEDFLQSDSEKLRRQKYEAVLKLQQENSGLIEPKSIEVLLPGMFLPPSDVLRSTESSMVHNELQDKDVIVKSGTKPRKPGSSADRPFSKQQSKSNPKKHGPHKNSRKQSRQWIEKDNSS